MRIWVPECIYIINQAVFIDESKLMDHITCTCTSEGGGGASSFM